MVNRRLCVLCSNSPFKKNGFYLIFVPFFFLPNAIQGRRACCFCAIPFTRGAPRIFTVKPYRQSHTAAAKMQISTK